MKISLIPFRDLIFALLVCSSFHLSASPEEPESIRIKQNSCEISSVNAGELICHSPLDTNKSISAGKSPRLFCVPEFSFCLHRQGGFLASWAIQRDRLFLTGLESYVYRLSDGSLLSQNAYSKMVSRKFTSEQIAKSHPGAFEKVTPQNFPTFNWNATGEVEAKWFSGTIEIVCPGQHSMLFTFKKGRFIPSRSGLTLRSTRTQPLRSDFINHRAAQVAPVSSNR